MTSPKIGKGRIYQIRNQNDLCLHRYEITTKRKTMNEIVSIVLIAILCNVTAFLRNELISDW